MRRVLGFISINETKVNAVFVIPTVTLLNDTDIGEVHAEATEGIDEVCANCHGVLMVADFEIIGPHARHKIA